MTTDKSKRIRKLFEVRPHMTAAQIARKIGMPDIEGVIRVKQEHVCQLRESGDDVQGIFAEVIEKEIVDLMKREEREKA